MNKKILLLIPILVVFLVFLSGCSDKNNDQKNNPDGGELTSDYESLHQKFKNAMENVASDFTEEESYYNYETSQNEIDYILNYTKNDFEEHKKIIYDNADIIDDLGDGSFYLSGEGRIFGYEYEDCRDSAIEGLNYLVSGLYSDAWSSFLSADDALTGSDGYGNMWPIQFGFEDGVCDVLYDMGYY